MLLRLLPWIFLFSCSQLTPTATEKSTIGIVSLEAENTIPMSLLCKQIEDFYKCKCVVLTPAKMPQNAFNPERNRYRADSILNFLDSARSDSIDILMAVTSYDISCTVKNHKDWGVFGLGRCPGRSCVISDFRLKNNVSNTVKLQRLKNVALHEIGHNFGLPHCGDTLCLMKDAKGKISNVEGTNRQLCSRCHDRIFE